MKNAFQVPILNYYICKLKHPIHAQHKHHRPQNSNISSRNLKTNRRDISTITPELLIQKFKLQVARIQVKGNVARVLSLPNFVLWLMQPRLPNNTRVCHNADLRNPMDKCHPRVVDTVWRSYVVHGFLPVNLAKRDTYAAEAIKATTFHAREC